MDAAQQSRFAGALLDPARDVDALVGAGEAARRRFGVHRNNVVAGRVDALAQSFPALQRLLGPEYFAALAGHFVRTRPPASAVLFEYGEELPDLIESFAPLAGYPWLADVARLERLRVVAWHAADAPTLVPAQLSEVAVERLPETRVQLHPSTRWLASRFPVVDLWQAQASGDGHADAAAPPQVAIVWRVDGEVHVRALDAAGFAAMRAVAAGHCLGDVFAQAGDPEAGLPAIARLLADGVFAAPLPPTPFTP